MVYRRTGAAVFFLGMAVAALVGLMAILVLGRGRAAAIWSAIMVLLALFALMAGVLPRLVVTDEHVEVHNMVTRYVIPYGAILRFSSGRRGVTVSVVGRGRRDLPVVALGRSAIASVMHGDDVARRAVEDVNRRMSERRADGPAGAGDPAPQRHLKPVEAAVLAAGLLAALVVLVLR